MEMDRMWILQQELTLWVDAVGFLYGYFSLKMVLMFIHVVKCVNPAFFFFCIVIKNK